MTAAGRTRKTSTAGVRQQRAAWMFVCPYVVGLALLFVYPFAASLYWSFCRYDLLSPPRFVGGENYARLADELVRGEAFGRAIWNTAYYALLSVPLSIVLGVGLAVLMHQRLWGRPLWRTLFFLPSIVPVVAASILWMWLLDPADGAVNGLLGWLGLSQPNWFKSPDEAAWLPRLFDFGSKDALVLMHLWGVGNFMIIYLAALGDIPKPLYEAARLDGAGPARRFLHVTLPMLSPVIFFNLVMGLIQSVQAFTQIYIVSEGRGAPAESTLVLSLHVFLAAFQNLEMGYASAIAWLMLVVLAGATAVLFRTARHWVHYQGAL